MNLIRILIVEDDYVLNASMSGMLEDMGVFVTSVYCGKEAISTIDRGEYLKALLTDFDLGPGPSGLDVAQHARKHYPRLPVVFVSGAADAPGAVGEVPGSVLIPKPFLPYQIRDALGLAGGLAAVQVRGLDPKIESG